MLNFYICDSDEKTINAISIIVKQLNNEEKIEARVVSATKSPSKFYEDIEKGIKANKPSDINAYIFDIDLKCSVNGIQLARRIRDIDKKGYIVFETARIECMIYLFKYNIGAFAFLDKPMKRDELSRTIQNVYSDSKEFLAECRRIQPALISFKSGRKTINLDTHDLIMIEASGNKCFVYTENHKYDTYENLGELLDKANKSVEVMHKVHRTYAINPEKIKEIDYNEAEILMQQDLRCIFAKRKKAEIKQIYKKHSK